MILKICLNHRDLTSSHKWAPSTTTSHQYISTSYLKMFYGYCPTILWCQTKYVEGVLRLDFFRVLPPRVNELNRESSSRAAEWGAWLIFWKRVMWLLFLRYQLVKSLDCPAAACFGHVSERIILVFFFSNSVFKKPYDWLELMPGATFWTSFLLCSQMFFREKRCPIKWFDFWLDYCDSLLYFHCCI